LVTHLIHDVEFAVIEDDSNKPVDHWCPCCKL